MAWEPGSKTPATVAEAIEASGLGWSVAKERIAVDRGDEPNRDWSLLRFDDIPAITRRSARDTRGVLGTLGGRYRIVQRQQSGNHAAGWRRDGLHGARVERRTAGWRPVRCEHAGDERSGMRGAWGYEPGPSLAPELLTDLLIGRPCASARPRGLE